MKSLALTTRAIQSFVNMFDLDAPILPGRSAGGITIGASVTGESLRVHRAQSETLHRWVKHDLGPVILWVREGVIDQIGVRGAYRGKIRGVIGIGDRIVDVQAAFGTVIEDDEDNLVVPSFPGWSFETEEWLKGELLHMNQEAVIAEIYVFSSNLTKSVAHSPQDSMIDQLESPANSPQKLARPGFGPPAEPAREVKTSRRHAARIRAPQMRRAARRSGFGTWALAVQLSV